MTNSANNKNTPKLRFPEFSNDGEWEEKTLGTIATLITEKTGNKKYTLLSVTAGIGIVSQMEKFGKEIAGESYKNYYVIKKNDFAYNKSSTKQHPEGQIAILENFEQGAVPNSIFTCFRVDKKKVLPYFLKYPFYSNIHGQWLRKFISVGARANGALQVDNKYLFALPILFPSLSEQQKIADCLSSLDELIAAQTDKVEALKTHKKGLMQQLFPTEGQTLPKLRFKEFENDGEWEEKALREMGEVVTGNTPSTYVPDNYGGDKLFVSPADITELRFINKTKTTLTEKGYSSTRKVPANSILFVCIGSTIGKVAQNTVSCATNQQINALIPFKNYDSGFTYYLLNFHVQKIVDLAGIQAVPIINKTIFSSVLVSHPLLQEQKKIADCLSSIDEQIAAESERIDALKAHKSGLMQGLFPNPEEKHA